MLHGTADTHRYAHSGIASSLADSETRWRACSGNWKVESPPQVGALTLADERSFVCLVTSVRSYNRGTRYESVGARTGNPYEQPLPAAMLRIRPAADEHAHGSQLFSPTRPPPAVAVPVIRVNHRAARTAHDQAAA